MTIDFLRVVFAAHAGDPAIVWREREWTYGWLLSAVDRWREWLAGRPGFAPGQVVSLEADFSPNAVALLLALVEGGAVVVPMTDSVEAKKPRFREIAEVESVVALDASDQPRFESTGAVVRHPLIRGLVELGRPGLVLFSSGSTGESKAALHDFVPLLDKFRVPRHRKRMITFLLFDHIGGINTLLYALANGGCAVTVADRGADPVLAAIERWRVEVLPASPTFLHLVLLSHAWERHDLSSLELVTYGTEVMPEATLRRLAEVLPGVRLQQTYGLSELGILRSKSRDDRSTWVRLGGEGYELRVRDGLLEVKAHSAMLGYLNAPSPFTGDGWFATGDAVEQDGEWLRILGRASDLINVGGEKVYPAEVEGVLAQLEGVLDVVVTGEPNAITGRMVVARVRLATGEDLASFRVRMKQHCRLRLRPFQIPQKVVLVDSDSHGPRFKKMRSQ